MNRLHLLAYARKHGFDVGDDCMITEMEWGYWVGGYFYVSKKDLLREQQGEKPALANKEKERL